MTQLSILEATKFCGKDRKTLYRAIKQGKLSATTATSGVLQIETSELIRVYGENAKKNDGHQLVGDVSMTQNETQEFAIRRAVLEVENRMLKQMLQMKEEHERDLKEFKLYIEMANRPKKPWWKF